MQYIRLCVVLLELLSIHQKQQNPKRRSLLCNTFLPQKTSLEMEQSIHPPIMPIV